MQEQTLYPYRINQHFVYVDLNKNIVIPQRYDMAYPFFGDYAIVVCKDKQGVINKKGVWILKPKHRQISIKKIGPVQIFISYDCFDRNYEFYKWRLIPNVNLFSQRGPLIATSVSYTKWCVFDETGKILKKRIKQGRYDDYNNHGSYYGENNHDYMFYYKNKQLFIHDIAKEQVYTYISNKKKKLCLHRHYKNVVIVIDKGYLFFKTDRKKAFLADFNSKQLTKEPYHFIQNLNIEPSTIDYATISNQSLWKYGESYLCSLSFGDAFIPVSSDNVSKINNLLYPLDRLGELFWLNMGGKDTGIISKSGEWILTDENIKLHCIYGDLTVLYKHKQENRYFVFKEGKTYAFPTDTSPEERINGLIWKSECYDNCGEKLYGIYDIEKQHYLISPRKSIHHLNGEFYKTIFDKKTNEVTHIIINEREEAISHKAYSSIIKYYESDEIVYVRSCDSRYTFYVIISSGEELREIIEED